MFLQGSLSIERMCQLVAVSRRVFYRSLREQRPTEEAMEVRSVIQQITLEHRRRYGYRRITAELHRRGMQVNQKRVVRIMREDNLLGIQPNRCFRYFAHFFAHALAPVETAATKYPYKEAVDFAWVF